MDYLTAEGMCTMSVHIVLAYINFASMWFEHLKGKCTYMLLFYILVNLPFSHA